MGNGLFGVDQIIACFGSVVGLLVSSRARDEVLSLQKAPAIQEGEAVTNSNSWI